MRLFLRLLREEDGPTAVEYAVMLAMIIGTCLVAIGAVGGAAGGGWQRASDQIDLYMNYGS